MLKPRFVPLVLRQVVRARLRSLLTIAGVAVAMFLFAAVATLQHSVDVGTRGDDTKLVVYRENRYCPFTSRMPQWYADRMKQMAGVVRVLPMKIHVSNCRASLDVITFRGVPLDEFTAMYGTELHLLSGSFDEWRKRSDAVLVGETLAKRRGLKLGDQFASAGVTAVVAGIIRADAPEHANVAYSHLDYLQYKTGSKAGGTVTQFIVQVDDPQRLEAIGAEIDTAFADDQDPTYTTAEQAFMARAASDVIELARFSQWLAWGCLAAVLALVGNAIVLSVQDRVREHAVLQTLGYSGGLIAQLIMAEGVVLSVAGGIAGTLAAGAVLAWGQFALSVEAVSIPFTPQWSVLALGLGLAGGVGVLAGLVPAWQAGRREIVACFREG